MTRSKKIKLSGENRQPIPEIAMLDDIIARMAIVKAFGRDPLENDYQWRAFRTYRNLAATVRTIAVAHESFCDQYRTMYRGVESHPGLDLAEFKTWADGFNWASRAEQYDKANKSGAIIVGRFSHVDNDEGDNGTYIEEVGVKVATELYRRKLEKIGVALLDTLAIQISTNNVMAVKLNKKTFESVDVGFNSKDIQLNHGNIQSTALIADAALKAATLINEAYELQIISDKMGDTLDSTRIKNIQDELNTIVNSESFEID
jgi:hypothetical protein